MYFWGVDRNHLQRLLEDLLSLWEAPVHLHCLHIYSDKTGLLLPCGLCHGSSVDVVLGLKCIHPSILCPHLIWSGSQESTHNVSFPVHLTWMSLKCRRKPEHLEAQHADTRTNPERKKPGGFADGIWLIAHFKTVFKLTERWPKDHNL